MEGGQQTCLGPAGGNIGLSQQIDGLSPHWIPTAGDNVHGQLLVPVVQRAQVGSDPHLEQGLARITAGQRSIWPSCSRVYSRMLLFALLLGKILRLFC